MNNEIKELCSLDMKLYQCITNDIDTNRVVLTDKQILHIKSVKMCIPYKRYLRW